MSSRAKQSTGTERRLTEKRNPASKNLDRMSAVQIVRLMNREDHKVAAAVAREIPSIARAVEAIAAKILSGGRLIYVGAGSSGRIAVLDASECPPTFGTPARLVRALIAGGRRAVTGPVEGAEDRPQDAIRDLKKIKLSSKDALVGIAASGTTPYVLAAIHYANRRKALTIGIASNPNSPLPKAAHIAITPEVGPEVLTGSTRLKAGTAQKMVLNGLMIDLGAVNTKLRARAKRILEDASARNLSSVEHALRQTKHDLRVALVMLKKGVTAEQAQRKLKESGGFLRKALGE